MRTTILSLILLITGLSAVSIRNQAQVSLNHYENELYTFFAGDIYSSYADNETLTNPQICSNIIEEIVDFGKESLDLYKSCDEKYYLLGEKHPLIEGERPNCFVNLVKAYCHYEIVQNFDHPHPNDLREFVTQTIAGCLKVIIRYVFLKLRVKHFSEMKISNVQLLISTQTSFKMKKSFAVIWKV